MRQYMQPMTASGYGPQGPDMGGMLMQGINAWQGMKRADAEVARQKSMVDALRGWGPMGASGGMGATTMPTEAPMAQTMGAGFNGVY